MKRFAIQPNAIDGASKSSSFLSIQQSAVDTACALPFLERVYLFPSLGYPPDVDNGLHERETERGSSDEVSRLTGVVCYKLDDVFERAIGCFQSKLQERQLMNRIDCVEALGSTGEG